MTLPYQQRALVLIIVWVAIIRFLFSLDLAGLGLSAFDAPTNDHFPTKSNHSKITPFISQATGDGDTMNPSLIGSTDTGENVDERRHSVSMTAKVASSDVSDTPRRESGNEGAEATRQDSEEATMRLDSGIGIAAKQADDVTEEAAGGNSTMKSTAISSKVSHSIKIDAHPRKGDKEVVAKHDHAQGGTVSKQTDAVIEFTIQTHLDRDYLAMISSSSETTCLPTSALRFAVVGDEWRVLTLDSGGKAFENGDELYISLESASNETLAVALIQSEEAKGSYHLDFVTPPMSEASNETKQPHHVVIQHQFTCHMGSVPPPHKLEWDTGGALRKTYHFELGESSPPTIKQFQPPDSVSLEPYDYVYFFGDSVMLNLIQPETRKFFLPSRFTAKGNVGMQLDTQTLPVLIDRLELWHGEAFRAAGQKKKLAVVLGSSTWDLLEAANDIMQGANFSDHLKACRMLVESTREKYPDLEVMWKSPSAVHVHGVLESCYDPPKYKHSSKCSDRIKYMSTSRAAHLNREQRKIMEELNVPYLHLFDAYYLSSDYTMPGDGRHYIPIFNHKMLSWFYPQTRIKPPREKT